MDYEEARQGRRLDAEIQATHGETAARRLGGAVLVLYVQLTRKIYERSAGLCVHATMHACSVRGSAAGRGRSLSRLESFRCGRESLCW